MTERMNYRLREEKHCTVIESLDDEDARLILAGGHPELGYQFVLRWHGKNIGIQTYDRVLHRKGKVIPIGDEYRFRIEIGDIGVRVGGVMREPDLASPYLFVNQEEQNQVLDIIRRFFTVVSFMPTDMENQISHNEVLLMDGLQSRIDDGSLIRRAGLLC